MPHPPIVRRSISLGSQGDWSLRLLEGHTPAGLPDRVIPASVPGCVHTDLMAAGLLDDPYLGTNELEARWVGECSWRYTGRFEVDEELLPASHSDKAAPGNPDPARVDLVFEGIDTLATVRLNGVVLGIADNMHATWRFDVREALRRGANVLEVDFPAPLPFCRSELERYRREIGDFPYGGAGANPQLPHHMLRKMHCNFGWDWGPQLVTCGIWRGVRLESWETARIEAVRPRMIEATPERAVVEVLVTADRALSNPAAEAAGPRGTLHVSIELQDPDGKPCADTKGDMRAGESHGGLTLQVASPRLWWPFGHGEQPLYTMVVSLREKDGGALLDRVERKVGLRTFEWITDPDEAPAAVAGAQQPRGATFHLRVNGRRVFCKGANWIPDDCFPHRVTPDRYRRRVQQARDANMNTLRVWGGGIYEDNAFYDACDELGIMVWQDFATACSAYPEDEAFYRRFEHEARDNVARLAGRASLALWCGGNECIQAVYEWGPEYRRMRDVNYGWGKRYWYRLFPRIVAALDPGTFYWPNSPWSARSDEGTEPAGAASSTPLPGGEALTAASSEFPANLEHIGDQHLWDVWNGQGDWRNYWSHAPRFASEFGFHGPPTWPTLEQAIPGENRHWFSEAMVLHNKQDRGQERAIDRARDHFRLPERPESLEAFEAMWFIAALNQARAIQAGCEWFRALSPWCGGALYWQLNDCWPVASWSTIDNDSTGLGRTKLLWHATRRFFAPRMVALLPAAAVPTGQEPAEPRVYLHNDHPEAWKSQLRLKLANFGGETLEEDRAHFELEPGGLLRFIVPGHWEGGKDRLILADVDGADRATWFFGRDKELPYPPPQFDLDVTDGGGAGTELTINAKVLLRDLCLFPERLDPAASASQQLITLLPRETTAVRVLGGRPPTVRELLSPGVIWTANAFGAAV